MALRIGLPGSSAMQNDEHIKPVILQSRTRRETNPKGHWGPNYFLRKSLCLFPPWWSWYVLGPSKPVVRVVVVAAVVLPLLLLGSPPDAPPVLVVLALLDGHLTDLAEGSIADIAELTLPDDSVTAHQLLLELHLSQ